MDSSNPKGTTQRSKRDLRDLAAAFLATPDVMCIVRVRDAMMVEVNDTFETTTGVSREEVLGKTSYDFPWWADLEERDRVLTRLREAHSLYQEEVRFIGPHGTRNVLVSASPITFRGEACAVWLATDITEQREAEARNRILEERLRQRQALERLGMLAGAIAHDFNNLLVGVLGNADLLLNQIDQHSPLCRPLRAIATSAQAMAEHTHELLDYAGRGSQELSPTDLDALLPDVLDVARMAIPSEVSLELSSEVEGGVWIRGDAGQLTRMLVNLIKNGAEALDGAKGKVSVRIAARENEAEVCVEDHGRGMDDATRDGMFEPFFSTKRSGRGLGLSSVPMIVERHDGKLMVSTRPGDGTTVTLRFPRIAPPSPKADPSSAASSEHRPRVLVVDDEAPVRFVARAMLEQFEYTVDEAADGEQALAMLRNAPSAYDGVLLDATMPGLDGSETLERIRESHPTLPVLLCSGYSATDFAALVSERPYTSFLSKPYRAAQLAEALGALVKPAD